MALHAIENFLEKPFAEYEGKKTALQKGDRLVVDFAVLKQKGSDPEDESENAGEEEFYHPVLFKPCSHPAKCTAECGCRVGHCYCEWYCECRDFCKEQYPGCRCNKSPCSSRICFCRQISRECTPGVCNLCFQEMNNMQQYYQN